MNPLVSRIGFVGVRQGLLNATKQATTQTTYLSRNFSSFKNHVGFQGVALSSYSKFFAKANANATSAKSCMTGLNLTSLRSIQRSYQTSSMAGRARVRAPGGTQNDAMLTLWKVLAGGAVMGIGLTAADGLRDGMSKVGVYPDYVSQRISVTYGYVVAGLGLTAATAGAIIKTGSHHRLMAMNPIALAIGSTVGLFGSYFATRIFESPVGQHAAWASFNAFMGLSLFPISMMGGTIIQKAAVGTLAIVGSISLIAATTRSDNHLAMGGPLAVGLGVVLAASVGQIFFPTSGILYNIVIYGGLAVFGGFTYFDTQRMIQKAKVQQQFNPLQTSMSIYMDIINIFTRMVSILGGGNRKK